MSAAAVYASSAISKSRDSCLATVGLASAVVVQVGVPEEEDNKRLVRPSFMLADKIEGSMCVRVYEVTYLLLRKTSKRQV
jgi:hypothetical protein